MKPETDLQDLTKKDAEDGHRNSHTEGYQQSKYDEKLVLAGAKLELKTKYYFHICDECLQSDLTYQLQHPHRWNVLLSLLFPVLLFLLFSLFILFIGFNDILHLDLVIGGGWGGVMAILVVSIIIPRHPHL